MIHLSTFTHRNTSLSKAYTTIDDTSLWYLSRVFAWASDYDWCVLPMLVELVMCWAGPQALSPPSRARSSPSRAGP